MGAENKKYGFKCKLKPVDHFKDLKNEFQIDEIHFSVKDNIFTVGYDEEVLEEKAKALALAVIRDWGFERSIKIEYDLDSHKWQNGEKSVAIKLKEVIGIADRVEVLDTTHGVLSGKIIYDSNDFGKDLNRIKIIAKNKILQKVFKIYEEEVLGNQEHKEKAFYGIYKIIEVFFPNSKELSTLCKQLNIDERKVRKLKESCQLQRHARPRGNPRRIYSIEEAIEITKEIIEKYIKHLISP